MNVRLHDALPLIATLGWIVLPSASFAEEPWTPLFNGRDLSGWTTYLDPAKPNVKPDDIWSIVDGVIVCQGTVPGYLLSEKEYENYVLRLQWRFNPKKRPGNSGVFVHVVGNNMIWPKGVEAQLQSGRAGDFWLVDGFKLRIDEARHDPKSPRHWFRTKDNVEKPLGEWNQYEITCAGNTVRLVVNHQDVNYGDEAELTRGRILLQSEGAEIHFRNIEIQPIR